MDETEEQDVEVKEVEEKIAVKSKKVEEPIKNDQGGGGGQQEPIVADPVVVKSNEQSASNNNDRISFSDIDKSVDIRGNEEEMNVPKTQENLNAIEKRKEEMNNMYNDADEEEEDKLRIGDDVSLDFTDVNDITKPLSINSMPPILDDIVILS